MKPKNFPGRKNERRKRALGRMKPPRGLSTEELARHPFEITRLRILPDSIARSIRTKKDRSAQARITR